MNKKDLVNAVAEKCDLSIAQTDKIVTTLFETIQSAMVEKGNVAIPGFGNFLTKVRAERKGRNPRTGEEMLIPKSTVPVFKPGSHLKESVNKE